jgi:hypothetical protein
MSMIDPIDFAIDTLDRNYKRNGGLLMPGGDRLPADWVLHDAAADVRAGIEFWKTLAGRSPAKRRASREFLNRNG